MDSFPYIGFYIKDNRGKFIDSLKDTDIKILFDSGMITATCDPFRYMVHKDYFLDDIMDELEARKLYYFERD